MTMFMNIQLFAHHKGGGSTKNGRDSTLKDLALKNMLVKKLKVETSLFVKEEQAFTQVKMLVLVMMTHFMQKLMVLLNLKSLEKTKREFVLFQQTTSN